MAAAVAITVRLEGGHAGLLADIVFTLDRVVFGKRVHQKAIRRFGVDLHHEATITGRMPRSGRSDLIARHFATERFCNLLQAWKLHNECSPLKGRRAAVTAARVVVVPDQNGISSAAFDIRSISASLNLGSSWCGGVMSRATATTPSRARHARIGVDGVSFSPPTISECGRATSP